MVVELLLDVWDSVAQEALWGLHASLRSLCIWCEESHNVAASLLILIT